MLKYFLKIRYIFKVLTPVIEVVYDFFQDFKNDDDVKFLDYCDHCKTILKKNKMKVGLCPTCWKYLTPTTKNKYFMYNAKIVNNVFGNKFGTTEQFYNKIKSEYGLDKELQHEQRTKKLKRIIK